jgi:LmbE family N-acetylglucosaminyl deacetylase
MPCESMRATPEQTEQERRAEIDAALRLLEQKLQAGTVTVGIGPTGAIVFKNWGDERKRVTDVCAFRKLTQSRSFALRTAVQRAEAQTGRKVNVATVSGGTHSHDGGQTWHSGH